MKTISYFIAGGALLVLAGASRADITTSTTTTQYESCSALHSMHIRTSDGTEVPVEDVLIDPSEGRIVTIVTNVDDRLIPLPWSVVHIGEDRSSATIEITRDRLVTAPTIERSDLATYSADRLERSESFFRSRGDNEHGSAAKTETTGGSKKTNVRNDREDAGNGSSTSTSMQGERKRNADLKRENVEPGQPSREATSSDSAASAGGEKTNPKKPEIGFGGSTPSTSRESKHSDNANPASTPTESESKERKATTDERGREPQAKDAEERTPSPGGSDQMNR